MCDWIFLTTQKLIPVNRLNSGNLQITYYYDAWGTPYCTYNTATSPYAQSLYDLNPLRYRGYVYDWEVGLYYLQSRCIASASNT